MSDQGVLYKGYDDLSLHVSEDTLKVWKSLRQTKTKDPERFGVIIGSRSEGRDEYWIESITTPYPKDRSTRYNFLLRDRNHQDAVDKVFAETDKTSVYLGTWHTHPEYIPKPSSIDTKDWLSCMRRNPSRQLFFVIVGIREVRIFVRKGFRFTKLIMDD